MTSLNEGETPTEETKVDTADTGVSADVNDLQAALVKAEAEAEKWKGFSRQHEAAYKGLIAEQEHNALLQETMMEYNLPKASKALLTAKGREALKTQAEALSSLMGIASTPSPDNNTSVKTTVDDASADSNPEAVDKDLGADLIANLAAQVKGELTAPKEDAVQTLIQAQPESTQAITPAPQQVFINPLQGKGEPQQAAVNPVLETIRGFIK